jgi:RNA polymerase sigma-70 factor (ECF subfamily)
MTDFHTLYEQHARDVYRFALYLSGCREDAEDITSETFMRVWNTAEPIRQATVRAYLLTIARHCYLKGLQRKSRHAELDEAAADPGRGPQHTAEQRSELERVLAALQRLPEVDRAALLLRAQDDLAYDEIARALGISLAAVKTKIHRARIKLMQARKG